MSKKSERRMMRAARKAKEKEVGRQAAQVVGQSIGPVTSQGLIDIVLPIFGEWSLAESAISHIPEALGAISPEEYRLIVLDNGTPIWQSSDGLETLSPKEQSKAVREMLRPIDHFFRTEDNIGYPAGINQCVARGRSALVLILTADVMLQAGAIEKMARELDNPEIGVVGPKLLFPSDMASPHGPPGKVQHAGICFDIRGKPKHMFIGWSPDNPRVNRKLAVAAVTGACFMTRRTLWSEVGGFDPQYGAGTFEDLDYCFSVRARRKQVLYCPEAVGTHLVSGAKLQGANSGFNIPQNESLFRAKYQSALAWDEWRYF